MADELPTLTLKPIGVVKNEVKEARPFSRRDWSRVVSEIVINPGLTEALDGLEEFSHIIVLYWMHLAPDEKPLKVHPRRNPALPLVGVFATRAPVRPSRIGLSTARLMERRGNVLKVTGLDALDGSPVIDIKPYLPEDITDTRTPQWVNKL